MAVFSLSENNKDYINNFVDGQLGTGFTENFDAQFENFLRNDLSISRQAYYQGNVNSKLQDQIKQASDLGIELPSLGDLNREDAELKDSGSFGGNAVLKQKFDSAVEQLSQQHPGYNWQRYDDILSAQKTATIEQAKAARANQSEINSRATFLGEVGSVAGTAAGAMSDPVNIASILATAPLAATSLIGKIGLEAGANAASEALIQAGGVVDWKIEQGLSQKDINAEAFQSVVGAGIGAAALTGVGIGLKKAYQKFISGTPNSIRGSLKDLTADKAISDEASVLNEAVKIEDTASVGVLTSNLQNSDLSIIQHNILAMDDLSKKILDSEYNPATKLILTDTDVNVISRRISDIENIKKDIIDGNISDAEIHNALSMFVPEQRMADFDIEVSKSTNKLKTLSNAEDIVNQSIEWREKALSNIDKEAKNLPAKKETLASFDKDISDLKEIVTESTSSIADLEKQVIDINKGLWGDIPVDQRDEIYKHLLDKIKQSKKDVEQFSKELDTVTAQRERVAKSVDKITERINNKGERISQIENGLSQELDLNRANSPTSTMDAAIKILDDVLQTERNKENYINFHANNPMADPSTLRQLVAWNELIANKATVGEFTDLLSEAETIQFQKSVNKYGLEVASERWLTNELHNQDIKYSEHLKAIAGHMDEIFNSFENPSAIKNFIEKTVKDNSVNLSPEAQLNQMKTDDIGILFDKLKGDESINKEILVFVDDNGTEIKLGDAISEIDRQSDLADLLEACR